MRRRGKRAARGSGFVGAVWTVVGLLGCSPKSAPPQPTLPVASVQPSATPKDASVMLPGIKKLPDASILHPGEGGIRVAGR